MKETHYDTLGITPQANDTEIKRAFRTLARQCHPDCLKSPNRERFEKIRKAYEAICTAEKRRDYNRTLNHINCTRENTQTKQYSWPSNRSRGSKSKVVIEEISANPLKNKFHHESHPFKDKIGISRSFTTEIQQELPLHPVEELPAISPAGIEELLDQLISLWSNNNPWRLL